MDNEKTFTVIELKKWLDSKDDDMLVYADWEGQRVGLSEACGAIEPQYTGEGETNKKCIVFWVG